MKIFKIAILLIPVLFFTACGNKDKPFVALSESIQENIESTDVYLQDAPDKMQFDIEKSNMAARTGGRLLFVLIDAVVESSRESTGNKAVANIQKALKPAEIQVKVEKKLVSIFEKTKWMKTNKIYHVKALDKDVCKKSCQESPSDTVMMSVFSYRLSPDFKTLMADIHLTLYPASDKIKSMIQSKAALTPIFKTHVSATKTLDLPTKDIQKNGAMWAKDDGKYLKDSMDEMIKALAVDLKNVLKYPNHSPEV